jgi:hypothetical protein
MSWKTVIAVLALLVLGAFAALYHYALPGLSSARPAPPAIEVEVATWLLEHSVPSEAAARQSSEARRSDYRRRRVFVSAEVRGLPRL